MVSIVMIGLIFCLSFVIRFYFWFRLDVVFISVALSCFIYFGFYKISSSFRVKCSVENLNLLAFERAHLHYYAIINIFLENVLRPIILVAKHQYYRSLQ